MGSQCKAVLLARGFYPFILMKSTVGQSAQELFCELETNDTFQELSDAELESICGGFGAGSPFGGSPFGGSPSFGSPSFGSPSGNNFGADDSSSDPVGGGGY